MHITSTEAGLRSPPLIMQGMGRISSELSKQMVDHTFDLWLNEETSRYVFRILGIKEILSRPAEYGFTLRKKQLYQPIRTRKLEIDTAITDLAQFAKEQGITYSQLKEFNLWLRGRELPNKNRQKIYYSDSDRTRHVL